MLAMAISLLFGLAAFAALLVVHLSIAFGVRRARQIAAELAQIEARSTRRCNNATRLAGGQVRPRLAVA